MDFNEEQLQMIMQCIPGYAVMYLVDGGSLVIRPFLYTKSAPSFSGLSEEEYLRLYGEDASSVILKQDTAMVDDAIKRIFAGDGQATCTYRTYHKTKGYVWTHAELKWAGEYQGKHVLLGTFRDVSRQIAEDTPGGFFIYAAQENDQFFFVSENMLRMLGYSQSEFEQEFQNRFRFMIYDDDRDKTLKSINDQIAENGQYDRVDYRIRKKDGSLLWVHDEGHYVTDRDGRSWFYVTINDISSAVAERRQLEEENSRLGGIINSIPAGIAVYKFENGRAKLVAATQMTYDIFGMTEDEMKAGVNDMMRQNICPDDVQMLTDVLIRVKEPGRHMTQPFRYDNAGNGWKWLRLNISTVRENDGDYYAYAVITDLTVEMDAQLTIANERRKKQESFQESVRELLFANPQSLCTVRLNLTKDRCEEWYGTSQYIIKNIKSDTADGVINNISGIILSERNRKTFLGHFNRQTLLSLFKSGRTRDTVRYRRRMEDGTSIWVETVVNMVENPDTHEIEAVLYSENVDDQELNREIIQKITDTGYDYIAILRIADETFFFRYAGDIRKNQYKDILHDLQKPRKYQEIVDYAAETWIDPCEEEHFREESRIENIIGNLEENNSHILNVKSRSLDGEEGWKQIRLTWLDDLKDWVMIQQTDVTDTLRNRQKELIERLEIEKKLRYEADKANESKSNFLSSVSHDMRTPLNAILGYNRLALEAVSENEKDAYLQKISRAGDTLLSLINDTLDLQKIETGTTTLNPAPVSCEEVVEGIMTAVKPMMDAGRINFTFDNSKAVMAVIDVDITHVQEIFINLLSNAAKFTPEGGHVVFSVQCERETEDEIYDVLTVKDDGCGISENFLPHIFEPFEQERSEKNVNAGGSGLGLSIVKRLVDLMHGKIEVESHVGIGTVFTVKLAFRKATLNPGVEKNNDGVMPSAGSLAGKKLLLCEDNEMNREIASAILSKRKIEVCCAANGKEGLKIFRNSRKGEYAAILMDIRMPVMDGYETAMAVRSSAHPDSRKIPIIAMTADAYSDDVRKATEAGMNAHLSKPIDVDRLMMELLRLIHG